MRERLVSPCRLYRRTAALDLVVDGRPEEGRIQIRLKERPGGRRVIPRAVLGDHAPVGEDFLVRGHVDIGKRLPAGLEEALLIPLRDVVVVSRDRHRSDSLDMPLQYQSRSSSPDFPATPRQFFKVLRSILGKRFKISLLQTSTLKRKVGSFGEKRSERENLGL